MLLKDYLKTLSFVEDMDEGGDKLTFYYKSVIHKKTILQLMSVDDYELFYIAYSCDKDQKLYITMNKI